MKILLTGATGFLGRRLVAALAGRRTLRLLLRTPAAWGERREGIELFPGDVRDAAAVRAAMDGCQAVIHAAALVKILAPARDFDAINVGGLDHVVAAMRATGIERGVYVSSFMALGPTENAPGGELDERAEIGERRWINAYERTKALADLRARQAIAAGLPLNVVYPGVIYGPGEMTEGNIVVRHLLDLAHRRLPALLGKPERRWNYVFVDDVADGIVRALEGNAGRPAPVGERFVLGGENVSQGDFYRQVAALGIPVPARRMPDALATMAGAAMKAWAQLAGGTPQLTPDLVEVYRHDWAYRSAKAEAELGYRPTPLAEGLGRTLTWLRAEGALPR
jgi:nucleoside-diphosphate-sugar epimerase